VGLALPAYWCDDVFPGPGPVIVAMATVAASAGTHNPSRED